MKYIIKLDDKWYYEDGERTIIDYKFTYVNLKSFAKRYDTYEEAEDALNILKQTCRDASSAQIEGVE